MLFRTILILLAGVAGLAAGSLSPQLSGAVKDAAARLGLQQVRAETPASKSKDPHGHASGHAEDGPEGVVRISAERAAAAGIELAEVGPGNLFRRIAVPGTIVPDAGRIARVAAKVVGTVGDMRKQLGDQVDKGELIAVLESREVADANSELLVAQSNFELQKTLFEREQALFQKNITAEQQFLRARTTFTEAQLRVDVARYKLQALNVTTLPEALKEQRMGLQRYEIRAPASGRIVERLVDLGAPVGGEGQAKELYVIADLSSVWVELAVPTSELVQIREGQKLRVAGADRESEGRIVFISPILNPETRSARVIAALINDDMSWRPGTYVSAKILLDEKPVAVRVPRGALQTIGGEQIVFVRASDGFEKREVVLGAVDDQAVEVVFGVDAGEQVAATNSFVLKADLGKAEAEHSH